MVLMFFIFSFWLEPLSLSYALSLYIFNNIKYSMFLNYIFRFTAMLKLLIQSLWNLNSY